MLHLVEILAFDILCQDGFILFRRVPIIHLFQISFRCYKPIRGKSIEKMFFEFYLVYFIFPHNIMYRKYKEKIRSKKQIVL